MTACEFLSMPVTTYRKKGGLTGQIVAREVSANWLETLMDCGQWDAYDNMINFIKNLNKNGFSYKRMIEEVTSKEDKAAVERLASLRLCVR